MITYSPNLPPLPAGMTPTMLAVLREQLEEDTLQALLTWIQFNSSAATPFAVSKYNGDLQAALDAAGAYPGGHAGKRVTVLIDQDIEQTKPFFVPASVNLEGQGKFGTYVLPTNDFYGYNWIMAPDASDGAIQVNGPFRVGCFNVPGQYTYTSYGSFDLDNHCFDLAQVPGGRVPQNASWTISFKFKPTATPAGIVNIYSIDGDLWPNHRNALFNLQYHPGTGFLVGFRYNGQNFGGFASFAAPPSYVGGTTYHFEISYDHSTKDIRFFVNGQKWTNGTAGALTLLSGGSGDADGSGMYQYPWEVNCIGPSNTNNSISQSMTGGNQPGTLSEYHIKQGVRHTASFTPGTDAPDNNTWLWIDFTEFYRGCLVGKTKGTTAKAYIYPTINNAVEMGGITMKKIYSQRGSGVLAKFASGMWMEQVSQLYCEDGWQFQRNGYFSHVVNCDIIAGQGRVGYCNQAGSYCTMDYCTWAMNIPAALADANIAGTGNSLTVQNVYVTALIILGGGVIDLTLLSVDAEVSASNNWIGTLVLGDVGNTSVTLRTPTLYGPTNKRTTDPIIFAVNIADTCRVILEQPYFAGVPSAGPVFRNFLPFGAGKKNWTHPIQIYNPTIIGTVFQWSDTTDYLGAAFVTPNNVVIPTDVLEYQTKVLGTAIPTTGYWRKGMRVININAVNAGDVAEWECTVAGEAGTWKKAVVLS